MIVASGVVSAFLYRYEFVPLVKTSYIITIKLTDGEFRICPVKNAKKSINISEVCSIHLSYEFSFCLLSILNKIYIVIIKNIKNPTIP